MAEIAKKTKRYPTDLTDEEWERMRPFLPKPGKRGRKSATDLREVLNAIRYMARSGGGWRIAAEGLSALADGILVVPALRAAFPVQVDPRHGGDDRPRTAGPGGQSVGRQSSTARASRRPVPQPAATMPARRSSGENAILPSTRTAAC